MKIIVTTNEGHYLGELMPQEFAWLRTALVEESTAEPLSKDAIVDWADNFRAKLRTLGLTERVYNTIGRDLNHPSASSAFAAKRFTIDGVPHATRLYPFEEWCRQVMHPGFEKNLLTIRHFGKGAYAELVEKVKRYLAAS